MSMGRQPVASPNLAVAVPPVTAQAAVPVSETTCCDRQLRHSERLASLGILAAGVAHEILNPLASVLAGVEALRRRILATPEGSPLDSPPEAERILDILERETVRARGIADSMMLLARPDTEVPAWLDVNRAVEETIALLRYQMNLQSVHVDLDLDRELVPIWALGGGVRGVCMNLMMNAVQAMAHGGRLTVRTRGRNGTVLVEVEDTGPGIPADRLNRIWDPFYTTKPPGEGTGLGLPISQTIVQRHGGSIRVENVEPRGARFTVELPVRFRR